MVQLLQMVVKVVATSGAEEVVLVDQY